MTRLVILSGAPPEAGLPVAEKACPELAEGIFAAFIDTAEIPRFVRNDKTSLKFHT
ncbi:MAG: hypothetical protein L6437_11115 [Kiritimatiellae bacterium]|nr:hypothetical protein [Kiritimatiellia bacterium]